MACVVVFPLFPHRREPSSPLTSRVGFSFISIQTQKLQLRNYHLKRSGISVYFWNLIEMDPNSC
jgi:hypothetical protein